MAWEPKEGSGSLFQNDKKGNEKAPGWRGDIMLDGTLYELAGWVKTTAKGDKFLSLSGKVKEERQKDKPQGGMEDMDSDLPF